MTKKESAPKLTKKVLHVGCGMPNNKIHKSFHEEGCWEEVRLDIMPEAKADILADMCDMHMVEDNSFDAIYSSHNLEHLFAHQVPIALNEFHRVLNPNGFVLLTMPNIQSIGKFIAKGEIDKTLYVSPTGPITPLDMIYGFRPSIAKGMVTMAHKTGFTPDSLRTLLEKADFHNIEVETQAFDLWAIAFKTAHAPTASIIQKRPLNEVS